MYRILVMNPGSTSTKVALFQNEDCIFSESLPHSANTLAKFASMVDQFEFRLESIRSILQQKQVALETIDAFVGRGGLLKPIASGTWVIDEKMLYDLRLAKYGEHASNLGAILAFELAKSDQKPSYIVDPVVVNELCNLARYSGHPLLPRKSIFHALNQKAVARKVATLLNKPYEQLNLIVAHMGGGISVASHQQGSVVDVNNALDGEGPFSPERSGTLPVGDLVRICFSSKYDEPTIKKMIKGRGGLVAYLNSNDVRTIQADIDNGNEQAREIHDAMAYQVSKEIASHAAVLKGSIDAIALCGGLAFNHSFIEWIKDRISFLAPVHVFAGEEEMQALALGALRVLKNEEAAKRYNG